MKKYINKPSTVYHSLHELKLRRIFPAVYFVNKNPLEERIQVLLSKKRVNELPDNSPNIFQKSNTDGYMERPSGTFCSDKYVTSDDFCYAEFSAYYTRENKPSKTGDYQPDELDDNLTENNHEECSYPPRPPLPPQKKYRKNDDFRRNNALSKSKANPPVSRAKQTFISRKIFLSCDVFVFSVQGWKSVAIRLSTIISKQTARARSSGCCKQEQNKVWIIWLFRWSGFFSI